MTTINTLTTYSGSVPLRTQTQAAFNTNVGTLLTFIPNMVVDINSRIGEMNTVAGEVNTNATNAASSETAAETARDLAQDWASKTVDVVVSGGKFSALHYSTKAEGFKDTAETAAAAAQSAAGLPSLVGAADYALKVNDAEDGVQWEKLPAPHPSNVVESIKTDTASTTSTTWVTTGMEVTITVSDAASRVLLMADVMTSHDATLTLSAFAFGIGGTPIELADAAGSRPLIHFAPWRMDEDGTTIHPASGKLVYTPGAGTHTFQLLWKVQSGTGFLNRTGADSDTSSYYRAVSSLIAMEVI